MKNVPIGSGIQQEVANQETLSISCLTRRCHLDDDRAGPIFHPWQIECQSLPTFSQLASRIPVIRLAILFKYLMRK